MRVKYLLRLERRPGGWWIVDTPPGICTMGPYESKEEADDDRRGVQRWLRDYYDPSDYLTEQVKPASDAPAGMLF